MSCIDGFSSVCGVEESMSLAPFGLGNVNLVLQDLNIGFATLGLCSDNVLAGIVPLDLVVVILDFVSTDLLLDCLVVSGLCGDFGCDGWGHWSLGKLG